MNKKIRVFETFAGIGAQNKALKFLQKKGILDYEIVATSEWDIFSNIAYNAIHHKSKTDNRTSLKEINKFFINGVWSKDGKSPASHNFLINLNEKTKREAYASIKNANNLGSIVDISGEELINKTGGVDLLTYSFPCQDLSVAGSFHGFNQGMAKGSGTRSGLLWEIERIMKQLTKLDERPKFLLLENVLNMVSTRHIKQYHEWLAELKKMGYSTYTMKLNSFKYGLPQARRRIYALSILDYKGEVNKYGEIMDMEEPEVITKQKDILKTLKQDYSIEKYKKEALACQPNRTESRERMFTNNPKLNSGKYKHSRTITTKQDRHPNAGVIDLKGTILGDNNRPKNDKTNKFVRGEYQKANYRFLTQRETYLMMGFSERDFENVQATGMRNEKMYQQAGNSIAVDVLIAIFNEMQKHW